MLLGAGAQLGPYQVLGPLGVGGMGEVYAARDVSLDRRVALKILPAHFSNDPQRLERFTREAHVLASLNHPNIATIHGVVEGDGRRALVLELVDGPTLADRIARGPIAPGEALRLARQLARALEYAHAQYIVHRDLKPLNIKVRPDGTVKVLDFGVAKALYPPATERPLEESTVTLPTDGIFGTAAYMSPEQVSGQVVDARTDIWAFGCVLYEMLTGRRAFTGSDTDQTIAAVIGAEPDWTLLPTGLSPAVTGCLHACLRKDRSERLHAIADVRLALEGVFDAPVLEPATGVPLGKRRRLPWLALGGAILAISATTALVTWRLKPAADERPLEFDIHAPSGTQFQRATMQPAPALSRDGRYLAFIASEDSTPALWVQAVGDSRARRLLGTENAMFPFWSAAGDYVAFEAAGRLQKIAATGDRTPQDLCRCDAPFGGAWSGDGTILFACAEGLFRVPADGGQRQLVAPMDELHGEYSYRFPHLLPDDQRFIYLVRSRQDAYRGLFLGSLKDPGLKRRLVPDDSNGSLGMGPDGQAYLFFSRGSDLLAQLFSLARGTVTGAGIVMARSVAPAPAGRFAPFAVGGRLLVYRQIALAPTRLRWMNRRGTPGPTIGPAGAEYAFPAVSDDGKRLAVTRRDAKTGKRDIWLTDLETGNDERLTDDPLAAHFPQWTSDGRIVFGSPVDDRWDVYWQVADGANTKKSLFHPPPAGNAGSSVRRDGFVRDISRDGRYLLYGPSGELWVQPLDQKSQPYRLFAADHGRLSPDGRWLAYTSREHGESEIYVTTFPAPSRRWRISTAGGRDPQWRRDGCELYYVATDQTLVAVDVREAVKKGAFDRVVSEVLFHATFDGWSMEFGSVYAPAPDGSHFLIVESLRGEEPVLNVRMNWSPGGR